MWIYFGWFGDYFAFVSYPCKYLSNDWHLKSFVKYLEDYKTLHDKEPKRHKRVDYLKLARLSWTYTWFTKRVMNTLLTGVIIFVVDFHHSQYLVANYATWQWDERPFTSVVVRVDVYMLYDLAFVDSMSDWVCSIQLFLHRKNKHVGRPLCAW